MNRLRCRFFDTSIFRYFDIPLVAVGTPLRDVIEARVRCLRETPAMRLFYVSLHARILCFTHLYSGRCLYACGSLAARRVKGECVNVCYCVQMVTSKTYQLGIHLNFKCTFSSVFLRLRHSFNCSARVSQCGVTNGNEWEKPKNPQLHACRHTKMNKF